MGNAADIERLADINDHLRRQLDKSNEIILELNHMAAKQAGEIAMLRAEKQGVRIVRAEEWAQIAEHNAEIANLEKLRDSLRTQTAEQIAEIAALREQVDDLTGKLTYNRNYAAAAFAQQRELIKALAAQVAELEAWKAAVERKIQKFSDLAEDWMDEAQKNSEDFEKFGRFHRIAGVYEYCVKELQEATHE